MRHTIFRSLILWAQCFLFNKTVFIDNTCCKCEDSKYINERTSVPAIITSAAYIELAKIKQEQKEKLLKDKEDRKHKREDKKAEKEAEMKRKREEKETRKALPKKKQMTSKLRSSK